MSAPVERALLALFAGVRSRSRRFVMIAMVGGALLAQTLLVVHRIDHNRVEHGATCMLCVAADHSPGEVGAAVVLAVAPRPPEAVASSVVESAAAPIIFAYHSRGPPEHLRA